MASPGYDRRRLAMHFALRDITMAMTGTQLAPVAPDGPRTAGRIWLGFSGELSVSGVAHPWACRTLGSLLCPSSSQPAPRILTHPEPG